MSTWNLGADDVSEETHALRNKLSSKDSQIAAQQDRLIKQALDFEELKATLNEALHKLSHETERALQLETDLRQRSEDLRDEQIASQNVQAALIAAQTKIKNSNLDTRDLQVTLETISHTSDEHKLRGDKLEKERAKLEARVKELEGNVTQPLPTTTPGRRGISRPRSSSLSNFRIISLEQDLVETRSSLAKKETELQAVNQKLSQVQNDLIKADNEKLASERKMKTQMADLQSSLEEKDEELAYLREQQGDSGREEELLKRIEEDEAKIDALEIMLRGTEDVKHLREKLRRVESQLKEEQHRLAEQEESHIGFIREKEDALDELEDARQIIDRLAKQLKERDARDHAMNERAAKSLKTCDDPLMMDDSCLIDMETLEPQPLSYPTTPTSHSQPDADTVTYIERLLAAIDRLRGERDSLQRDVQFLESESKFAIEALEAKLSASISTASDNTVATLGQMKAEMDALHSRLAEAWEHKATVIRTSNTEIRRLSLLLRGSIAALGHIASQAEVPNSLLLLQAKSDPQESHDVALKSEGDLKDLESRLDVTVLCLEAITSQRDDLLAQLVTKESHWEKELETVRLSEHETREELDEVMHQLSDLNAQLEDIESERDSLTLHVTNLTTDLQNLQDELTNAESRYTSLQFHQLSNMTNNEATRTLREHIEELEHRVMRRTEQIGIHQHDIRRLETNLRLQEERLSEMTTELEMMAAQKDAMVEDCADARETRDEAIVRVEALEVELEASETRDNDNQAVVTTLISTFAQTVCRAREAIRRTRCEEQSHYSALEQQSTMQRQQIQDKDTALAGLSQKYHECRDEIRQMTTTVALCHVHSKCVSEQADSLLQERVELESRIAAHETTIQEFKRLNQGMQERLQERQPVGTDNEDAERQLVQVKLEHAEALGAMQIRLVETSSALEELQTRWASAEGDYHRGLEEAHSSMQDLEERLALSTSTLTELRQLRDQSNAVAEKNSRRLLELEEDLSKATRSHEEALELHDALEAENVRLKEELVSVQQEHAAVMTRWRDESLASHQELEKKIGSLQAKFEEQARLLEISKEEAARLSDRLQEESSGRYQEKKQHAVALLSAKEEKQKTEERLLCVCQELASVRENFEQSQAATKTAEDEKDVLQQEITTLEAEVQRSKSLSRYLEAQVQDCNRLVTTLKGDVEHIQADLARSEKSCKAAEVNLSLQNAQHKREMAEVQRELSAYRSRPNLDQAIAELEQRNNEMEELLRSKCAEIEENDDRTLEMLKEKKKLTTKVESLTRKVQNLQAKVIAAKASSTTQPCPEPNIPTPPSSAPSVSPTLQTISAHASRPRSATVASVPTVQPNPFETPSTLVTRQPFTRVVSGPSSLPRPKTPERTRAITPVFKARTPERRMMPEVDPLPSTTVIGKKRAAPDDDFEAYENLPAQAFTADGEDVENRTPRVRRVLNSLQSGFTPVRNQNGRSSVGMPSPRRGGAPSRMSPFISDSTNSPLHLNPVSSSAKQSKRSWLGKIRGTSQAVERPSNMRSLFDR
ncbi:hypothetical protein B0H34DRAFT_739969 [Crassisporium funariophilum]|nr:hypothetical protein B0H34DRAFT_739969 [Crassisporium funariophilum]